MSNISIKNKVVSSVAWTIVGRYSTLLIQFFVTVIIARILSPQDFGVIGLLTVFTAIGGTILDSGFGQALIQRGNASRKDLSSVFFLNLILGCLLYLVLYISSPYIASFYNLPELEYYAKIIFLIIPINSLGLIQNTILMRDMRFNRLAIVQVVSAIISGIIGIWMAYTGYGIKALVGQIITLNLSRTLLYLIMNRWIPMIVFSLESIKSYFKFGSNLLITGLLTQIFRNIYVLVIGKAFSTDDVGYFNQARRFEELGCDTITGIIVSVSFPAMVKFKEDIDKLRQSYRRIVESTIFIIAPLMIGVLAVSEELFTLILTEKWLGAVPLFNLLCIYGATFPLHQININILKVLGKGKQILKLELLRRGLLAISIIATYSISISAMLWGQIIAMAIMIIINMQISGSLIGYSFFKQLKDVLPYYLVAIPIVLIANYILPLIPVGAQLVMWIQILFIVVIYFITCKLLNLRAMGETVQIFKDIIKRK